MAKRFRLHYSPLFYSDLDGIIDYILVELKNEIAARTLLDETEKAIKQHLANPLQPAAYPSTHEREHDYRRIIVGSYLIFYVVIDDTVIIRRMLYGRRNLDKILT